MGLKDYWTMLRGGLKIKSEVNVLMEKKPGWKTSEFWLSLLSIVATAYGAFGSMIPATLAVQIIAGLTLGYTLARAVVKFTLTPKDDELLAKIALILSKMGIKTEEVK